MTHDGHLKAPLEHVVFRWAKKVEEKLFGSDSDSEFAEWRPPGLKATEKDRPVTNSLANLINVAFSTQCDNEDVMTRYKIPENTDKACPPLVNNEIWKILDRKVHSQDKIFQMSKTLWQQLWYLLSSLQEFWKNLWVKKLRPMCLIF